MYGLWFINWWLLITCLFGGKNYFWHTWGLFISKTDLEATPFKSSRQPEKRTQTNLDLWFSLIGFVDRLFNISIVTEFLTCGVCSCLLKLATWPIPCLIFFRYQLWYPERNRYSLWRNDCLGLGWSGLWSIPTLSIVETCPPALLEVPKSQYDYS